MAFHLRGHSCPHTTRFLHLHHLCVTKLWWPFLLFYPLFLKIPLSSKICQLALQSWMHSAVTGKWALPASLRPAVPFTIPAKNYSSVIKQSEITSPPSPYFCNQSKDRRSANDFKNVKGGTVGNIALASVTLLLSSVWTFWCHRKEGIPQRQKEEEEGR